MDRVLGRVRPVCADGHPVTLPRVRHVLRAQQVLGACAVQCAWQQSAKGADGGLAQHGQEGVLEGAWEHDMHGGPEGGVLRCLQIRAVCEALSPSVQSCPGANAPACTGRVCKSPRPRRVAACAQYCKPNAFSCRARRVGNAGVLP